jgi:hypothetical protein
VTILTPWLVVTMVALAVALDACSMEQQVSAPGTASLGLPQATELMPNGMSPLTIRGGGGSHGGGGGGGGGGM